MKGKLVMTPMPPSTPAGWYHPAKACVECRAKVMNRIERADGSVALRVLHEESCWAKPEPALEAPRASRGGSGTAAVHS